MAAALLHAQDYPRQQPLPPNNFDLVDQVTLHEAYQVCLEDEADAGHNQRCLMYARCLGYLLRELGTVGGCDIVANEILECRINNQDTSVLAEIYINHLIRLFRQHKGRTPAPSQHPSRPSFEMHAAFFGVAIEPAPRDHSAAKRAALQRDNFRCMVTGQVDRSAYEHMNHADRVAVNFQSVATNFCHIFPPSTNWDLKPDVNNHLKTKYSGSVWAIIHSFQDIDVLTELNGDNIHSLTNGLTLCVDAHILFDDLGLWFEEQQGPPNTYEVKTLLVSPYRRHVTFTTTLDLKLPDPRYLRLHAAVCRVAHLSGAAGYLDYYDRKMEENDRVLATDGSSADLLASQLHKALIVC